MQIAIGSFNVAGVMYRPANVIDSLVSDQQIRLVSEPENPYDKFAIRVEVKVVYTADDRESYGDSEIWELIGYIPKKVNSFYHLFRRLKIPLTLKLFVNHDAGPTDKLLVKVTAEGDENASF